jgi:hypothetical protein
MQAFGKESVDNQQKIMTSGVYIRQHNNTSVDVPESKHAQKMAAYQADGHRLREYRFQNTQSRKQIAKLQKHPRVEDIDAGVHRSFAIGDRKIIELK